MNIYFNQCESNEKKCKEILNLPKHIQLALYEEVLHNSSFNRNMNYLNIVRKENKLHCTLSYKELKKGTYSLYIKSFTTFGFTYNFDTKKLNIWNVKSKNFNSSDPLLLDVFVFLSQNREKYKIDEFDNGLFDIDLDIEILEETFNNKKVLFSKYDKASVSINSVKLLMPTNIFRVSPSIYKNIVNGKIKTKNDLLEYILRYSYRFKKSFLTSSVLEKISDLTFSHNDYKNIRNCFNDEEVFTYYINLLHNNNLYSFHKIQFDEILSYASYINYKFNKEDIKNLFNNELNFNLKFLKNLKEKDAFNRHIYNLLYLPANCRAYNHTRQENIYANDLPF